jgi:PAS domain S-box-containing protein
VSLLSKRGLKKFPGKESSPQTYCWEFLSCTKVLCPAHGKLNSACWLVPKTHYGVESGDDFFQQLAACLECPFFKKVGDQEKKGWNWFVTEQLRRYNARVMEQIYQKEESFLEILNRIPDGLFTTDQEFRITYFNSAAEKITGFSAYDAVGMYCKDVFKNRICEVDCALKQAVANRTNIYNREYTITNVEGRKIPIICSTTVFRDPLGKITGGIEIFKDVTELKNLQEENIRREKKYRRIFEGSHDMIYITNQGGALLDVNQAAVEMLGYSNKRELLSLGTVKRLYNKAEDRDQFLTAMSQEGAVRDFEVDFKRKDGTPIHVLISSRQYQNSETGDIEFEGIIKDITQRKLAEEAIIQRNVELSILNATAMALNRTLNLSLVFKVALKNILRALGLKGGGIFLIDSERKRIELQASRGLPPMEEENQPGIHFKDALLKKYLLERNGAFFPKPIFPPFQMGYPSRKKKSLQCLSCFLITSKGKGLGFIGLNIPPGRDLSAHENHLLGSLANFLGGGIENANLIRTIRRHRQELRRLTKKLFQTQEEERRRIARELHDEAGQALTAVKLSLERLEEALPEENQTLKNQVEEIRQVLQRTSREIRNLSYRLHPTLLSDLGLEPALNLYLKGVSSHSNLKIEFRMVGFDHRLDPNTETVLYRFSQETLNNTLKHSQAENFRLSIIKSYPKIIFLAEDDGVGFDGQIRGSGKRNLGLLGLRERTSLLEGTFQLKSQEGEGTKIRIEIPLKEHQEYGGTH